MFRYLVLGLLRDGQPKHGYAIRREYISRSGVEINSGSFYRELQRLVDDRLLRVADGRWVDDRRTPYAILDAGRSVFDRWICSRLGDLEAGADVIFVEAPTSMEQAAAIPKLIRGPVMYNWVFAGRSPLIHPDVLTELGYSHYLQADILYAVSHALKSYFSALKTTGTYGEAASRMITFDDFNQLVGLEKIKQAENTYEHLLRPVWSKNTNL